MLVGEDPARNISTTGMNRGMGFPRSSTPALTLLSSHRLNIRFVARVRSHNTARVDSTRNNYRRELMETWP